MTAELDDKKSREEAKKFFIEEITSNKTRMNDYKFKADTAASRGESPTMKSFYVSLYVMHSQHAETLEILDGFFDGLLELNDELKTRIDKLERGMQNISEKTGMDISTIRNDVNVLKTTVGPKVNAVIELFANLKKKEDERKANEGKSVV